MRKNVIKILGAVFCLLLFFCVVGCGNNNSKIGDAQIVGWQDSTEEVILGSSYQLSAVEAKDSSGTEYAVETIVINKATGKELPLILNSFDIISIKGYEIVYTAYNGENKGCARMVRTLTVKDEGSPIVMISGNNIAEVGKKFAYPTINVVDDSGSVARTNIEVYDSKNSKVDSDDQGFIPLQIGYYTIKVNAIDEAGNYGESSYEIYARRATYNNELDGFDDKGFISTTYTLDGDKKINAGFSAFKMQKDSFGSAYFNSTAGKKTEVYMSLRKSVEEYSSIFSLETEDAVICATVYILDDTLNEREISFANASVLVETNKWVQIKISSDATGKMIRWLNRVAIQDVALFSVKNDASPYTIFIDKVDLCDEKNGLSLTGVKDNYNNGEDLVFTALDGYATELYCQGNSQSMESGYKLEEDGEYVLVAKKANYSDEYYYFTVGNLSVRASDAVYISKNQFFDLPTVEITENGTKVSGETAYYILDESTGEYKKAESGFMVNGDYVILRIVSNYNGKTVSALKTFKVNRYSKNAWFGLDVDGFDTEKLAFHKTFNDDILGELKNVIEIKIVDDANVEDDHGESFASLRFYWNAVYTKEYYEQFEFIVFKMRATTPARFAYIGENPWHALTVSNEVSTSWKEYYVPMAEILEDFDNFAKYCITWQDGEINKAQGHTYESIFIADIYCVEKEQYPSNMWFNTDSVGSISGANPNWEYLESFDGESGVVKVSTASDSFAYNRTGFAMIYDEDYYKDFDYLVFKVKADTNVQLIYGSEDPWKFEMEMQVTSEWQEFRFKLSEFVFTEEGSRFEDLLKTGMFYIGSTAGGVDVNIYIASVTVEATIQPGKLPIDFENESIYSDPY